MLGQSKTAFQAEIDAACELIDFWRFNVHYAKQILAEQPIANSPGVWNRTDHRPLEGFVYAITPFNFTAIAGNLPTAPALMGNTVVWKPSPTQQLAASLTMDLLEEAGLPPGVINMLPGDGLDVSKVALDPPRPGRHPLHRLDADLPAPVAHRRREHRVVPLLPAHRRRDRRQGLRRRAPERRPRRAARRADPRRVRVPGPEVLGRVAGVRRPVGVGARCATRFLHEVENITMGDVTDFSNFMGAVIDDRAFAKHKAALARVSRNKHLTTLAGGKADDSVGYFVRPTVVQSTDPTDQMFTTEYFGPILAVHVYPDAQYDRMLRQMESFAPYALTGAIIAQDRRAIADARRDLRFAAGNFYINDKPTGAVVGQQPFGGARASGTNDKAGAAANLMRWTSPRSIKETFVPPKDYRYPFMG